MFLSHRINLNRYMLFHGREVVSRKILPEFGLTKTGK